MGVKPVISVITPTKNRLALLTQAMSSVMAQSFTSWEHIIVDDGSGDGTSDEVIRQATSDERIRYIQSNGNAAGANACRNIGVCESRSELIMFLDSDDLLAPHCLASRVEFMRRNLDLDFAVFQTAVFRETPGDIIEKYKPEQLGDDLLRFLFFECPWIITSPVWRKTSLLRLGLFDESLLSWQDIDLHIRAITAGYRYLRIADVDHHVRWQFEPTKVSIQQRRSQRHLEAAIDIIPKFERLVRDGPGMDWVRQRALCSLYFFIAQHSVAAGRFSHALGSWKQIRERQLGSHFLYISGLALLTLQRIGVPDKSVDSRLTNKWKGWMRLRTNPELVRA